MAMPDRAGFFDAMIEGVGVTEVKGKEGKPNKLQVSVGLYLAAMKNPNRTPAEGEPEWYAVHDQDWHITAYLFLQKNDGSVNDINLDMVKRVFPQWDGWDFEALNSYDTTGMTCRATLEEDNYNGKTTIRVRFIHEPDYEGGSSGVKKADATEIKSIMGKFGSQFRALAKPAAPAAPTRPGALPPKPAGLPPKPAAAPPVAAPVQRDIAGPNDALPEEPVAAAEGDDQLPF